LTAPSRQPGGEATAKEAKAKNVAVKRLRASMMAFVDVYGGWE
jgi:hypothetical protein